ncbi:unnamed protein product [Symbiodinium sp. CCMP2456]|nr:unnamed protein product [Symbiodinium sp. CCMP2456]
MEDFDLGGDDAASAVSVSLFSGSTLGGAATRKKRLSEASAASAASTNSVTSSKRGRKEVQKECLMPTCDELKKPGSKFCRHHHCHADNAKYSASKVSAEQQQAVVDGFKDDAKAVEMVEEWSQRNIASPLFKNGVCDWSEWNARFGLRVSIREGAKTKPYEKREFIIRQVSKFGRTEEQAKGLWNEAEASSCRRDHGGFQGQLRLWLAKEEYEDKAKERFVDESALEGTNRKKKMKDKDRDAMRMHVHELNTGFGHEFFQGQSSVATSERPSWQGGGPSATFDDDSDAEDRVSQPGSPNPASGAVQPAKEKPKETKKEAPTTLEDSDDEEGFLKAGKSSKKKVPLLNAKTAFVSKMTGDLSSKTADLQRHVTVAKDRLNEHTVAVGKAPLIETDKMARDMYIKRVHVHLACVLEWQGETVPDEYKEAAESEESKPKADGAEAEESEPKTEQTPDGFVKDASGLIAMKSPQFFAPESFDGIQDEKKLMKQRLVWARMLACLVELTAGMKHAAVELGKHIKAEDEKKAAQTVKKDAEERAKKIKAVAAGSTKTFFTCPADAFTTVPRLSVKKELGNSVDFDIPFIVADSDIVQAWMAEKLMTVVTTSYGIRYSKQDAVKSDGKHTQPLMPTQGKEVTEAMFAQLLCNFKGKIVDMSEVSASWGSTSWLFGYSNDFEQCNFTPNSAGALKILVFGSLSVYMVRASSLLQQLPGVGLKATSTKQLIEIMEALSPDTLKKMTDAGLKFYRCQLEKSEVMWVPTGWLLFEKVTKSALLYGVRKSVFMQTPSLKADYQAVRDLYQASGHNVDKMTAVSKLFEK